jgi:ABC-type phosphate transport system permease subunit
MESWEVAKGAYLPSSLKRKIYGELNQLFIEHLNCMPRVVLGTIGSINMAPVLEEVQPNYIHKPLNCLTASLDKETLRKDPNDIFGEEGMRGMRLGGGW